MYVKRPHLLMSLLLFSSSPYAIEYLNPSLSVCNSKVTSFCGFQTLERTLNALLSTPEPLRRHDPSIVVTPETRVRAQTQTPSTCVCRPKYCPLWNVLVWTQAWNKRSHWLDCYSNWKFWKDKFNGRIRWIYTYRRLIGHGEGQAEVGSQRVNQ